MYYILTDKMLHNSCVTKAKEASMAGKGAVKVFTRDMYDQDDNIEEITPKMIYYHKRHR
jgi:hypothetical protein